MKKKINYYYNLIKEISWTDFKLKYYGSVLGMFWSFLKPFLMLLILYIVFNKFLNSGIDNYHIYLLLGIAIWNYFSDGTTAALETIKSKKNILQKINLAPVTVIISTILHSFWSFIIAMIIFFMLFFAFGMKLTLSVILLPLFMVLLTILILGVSLIITPLHMRFRDFEHIWDVFLKMLFWITPIVYQYQKVPDKYINIYLLNPVARLIVDARNAVIYGFFPNWKQLIITTIIILIIFIMGVCIFKKYSRELIEKL